jgi:hypothetical protein
MAVFSVPPKVEPVEGGRRSRRTSAAFRPTLRLVVRHDERLERSMIGAAPRRLSVGFTENQYRNMSPGSCSAG